MPVIIRLIALSQAQRQIRESNLNVKREDEGGNEPDLDAEDDKSAQLLDRLCLALGLLTNLVQNVPEAKSSIRDTCMPLIFIVTRDTDTLF